MRVKKKLQINAILTIAFAIVIGLSICWAMNKVNEENNTHRLADNMVKAIAELSIVTYEYVLHHEEWSATQWRLKYDSIREFLNDIQFHGQKKITLQNALRQRLENMDALFTRLISNYDKGEGLREEKLILLDELQERLTSRLIVHGQDMVSKVSQLHTIAHAAVDNIIRDITLLVALLTVIMGLLVSAISYFTNRGLASSIDKLHKGSQVIGSGNLDFKLCPESNDEIGQLSIAFNQMVENLKRVMASRDDFEKEILERKQAEEEKERLEAKLQRAQKMEAIGTLAGGIAHDFNNLLSIILGNLSLLKYDTKLEPESSEYLLEAENASLRAKDLTTRLITFSKGGDPVKKVMAIGAFIKESVPSALGGSDMDGDMSVPDDLFPVEIDEDQMKQVISNMVINAHEAMDGKGMVRVHCENVTISDKDVLQIEEGKYVKISIEDRGVGIAEENLGKIFDPYFSTKERGAEKGMGLGLSVCHSIVEKHNGLITVESELGKGSMFYLYLPASEKAITKPKSPEEDLLKEPISGSGRLLVMDDEVMIRKLAINRLSRLGYDVEVAGDGAESIALYEKARDTGKPFDVVILDLTIQMGMGGKETIQELREIDPDVKGIVATGYSDDPVVTNFKDYGFRGALTKPYTTYELSKVLHDVISEE